MPNQKNYYKDQTSTAYIKLKYGQPDLFNPGSGWRQVAMIRDKSGKERQFNFTYTADREIVFDMPTGLSLNSIYEMAIINRPTTKNSAVDENVQTQTTQALGTDSVLIETRFADSNVERRDDKMIYSSFFETSRYGTVQAKFEALQFETGFRTLIANGIHKLLIPMDGDELFDRYEIKGTENIDPMIRLVADLSDNKWYKNKVYPQVYQGYPYSGLTITHRDPESLGGIPPVEAIYMRQTNTNVTLTEEEVTNAVAIDVSGNASISYELAPTFWSDYWNLSQQAAGLSIRRNEARLNKLMEPFPSIINGKYQFTLDYRLPGRNTSMYSKTFEVKLD